MNIWESLLRESSKNSTSSRNATVLFLGDQDTKNIKRELLSQLSTIKDSTIGVGNVTIENYNNNFVEYQYMSHEDNFSLDMWTFDSSIWGSKGEFQFPHQIAASEQIIFVIIVNLSNPVNVVSATKTWLRFIQSLTNDIMNRVESGQDETRKHLLSNYVYNISRNSNDNSSKDSINSCIPINFGFPILIAGFKTEVNSGSQDDFQELQRLKLIQGQLRSLSLEVGGALLLKQSCLLANKSFDSVQDESISLLKSYLIHRAFELDFPSKLQIEETNDKLFVPSGFDSEELISISTGFRASSSGFASDLHLTPEKENNDVNVPISMDQRSILQPSVELENEKEWLSNLQSFVAQISSVSSNAAGNIKTNTTSISRHTSETSLETPELGESKITSSESVAESSTTRRVTRSNPSLPQDKKDVDSFFRNLLTAPSGGPTKLPPKK